MTKSKPHPSTYTVIILRAFVALVCLAAFLPFFNPARMSGFIPRNATLFTNAISYSSITGSFQQEIISDRIPLNQSMVADIYWGALVAGIAILGMAATACLTFGNAKMRRLGSMISGVSGIIGIVGIVMLQGAYRVMSGINADILAMRTQEALDRGGNIHPDDLDRLQIITPNGIMAFYIMFGIVIATSVLTFLTLPKMEKGEKFEMDAKYRLFLMIMPFMILAFLFSYLPLTGWRFAFGSPDEGMADPFYWFRELFTDGGFRMDIPRVMRNTFAMSGIGIATSWLPMVFAIFLAEIKANKPRRIIQTFTTIPNFISWILVYSVAFAIFSQEGFFNWMLINLGVIEAAPEIPHLMNNTNIWLKMWAWGTWKGLAWSAIIYIAGISSIDPQLYEAATVDGAGRFRKMWHITVPGLLSTFFVLLLLSIANMLSNGMEQYLVFQNPATKPPIEVLDLYIYNIGIGADTNLIEFATIVGMFKTVISITLLFTANRASKWLRGESIV
jgi:putative aldouronate transport system permease protein